MAETFKRAELSNGLRIVAEVDPAAHTASAGFFVKTGTRDEALQDMGVSHFLEHMMFKGTNRRSAEDINREFDAMGARSNAYTSSEMTAFYAAVLPEKLSEATDVLADMMRPALREEDFQTEKGVILEEIAMYKDEPTWVLYESAMESYFASHPLGYRVLGTTQSITDLRSDRMREYFAERYSADNTVMALAGKVDFDGAVAQIEKLCGHWQRTKAGRDATAPRVVGGEMTIEDAKVSRAYRMMIAPGPHEKDERRYTAFVMTQLLGAPDNSRLHWALIETGLAEEAEVSSDPKDGTGDTRVLVACEPDRLEEVWGIVEKEIVGLASVISEEDVRRVRAKAATGVTLAGERPEGRMHRLGRQMLTQGTYTTLREELDKIERVTVKDVRELLEAMPMHSGAPGRLIATLKPAAG